MTIDSDQYDVAILGAGFEGGLLGTILACNGVKVLMIESGIHPRFAVGESTVRHTFRMLKIMAERFKVPELIECFSSCTAIHEKVSSQCGEKRNFGFVYHHEGQTEQRSSEATQLCIPPFREGYEAHLYRQDTDAWLTFTAARYGAHVEYRTNISEVDINEEGVTLVSQQGKTYKAKYVVDGTGYRSVLAKQFGLREEPTRCKTHTRCLFTHMLNVTPYDDLIGSVHHMQEPWYSGTCHHIFDGGWLWVIPFNNRVGSTNPLCSIGLTLDPRKFPKPKDLSPEQEFRAFLDRFPSMKDQFTGAVTAREWVSTERLQFSSSQGVGYRWCLMAHAYGFIDALFSRGLANAAEATNALAARLIKAVQENDYSTERFEYLDRLHRANLDNNDRMVNSALIAFRSFKLWNAWFRVWALGVGLGDLRLASISRRYHATGDESVLPDNQEPKGLFCNNHDGYGELFNRACAYAEDFEAGKMGEDAAAAGIFKLIENANFASPSSHMADPDVRCINVGTLPQVIRTLQWAFTSAPADIRQYTRDVLPDLNPLRPFGRKVSPTGA